VFYISFYRVIQEDAWEKAGEGGLESGPVLFLQGIALFLIEIIV
jgi:hypothetical protein